MTPGELRAKNRRHFKEFWKAFPKKVAINDAERAFTATVEGTTTRPGVDPEHLIAKAKAYSRTVDPDDLKYVPSPASWLSAGRYDDQDLFTNQREQEVSWLKDQWRTANTRAVEDRFHISFPKQYPPDDLPEEKMTFWYREKAREWITSVYRERFA